MEFFNDMKSFRSHCGPGVDSASNINEYREYFLRGKGGRCLRLVSLPPFRAVVMEFSRPITRLLYLYKLQIVTAELQTDNVAYFQKNNPVTRICCLPGWPGFPINTDKWGFYCGWYGLEGPWVEFRERRGCPCRQNRLQASQYFPHYGHLVSQGLTFTHHSSYIYIYIYRTDVPLLHRVLFLYIQLTLTFTHHASYI
jgi:hypothetical protein